MADPTDTVELALEDLANEPLPTHTREVRPPPEDDVEIDYADDGTERPAEIPENRGAPPVEQREIPPAEGIAELQARLQNEQVARRQAEERAAQAEQARVAAVTGTQEARVEHLTTALDGVRQYMGVLEANLAEAYAVQDFAQAAKIQTEIARTAQRETAIEGGLEQLKVMPREQPRAPPPQDRVEEVARQLTPNAAAWVRAHPDYITDPAKNARLMAAHYDAIADGLTGDSPDYINFVEGRVLGGGARREQSTIERHETVAEQPRRSAPPAAPVSRGSNGASSPTRVSLTREQRETAHDNFPDEMREDPSGLKAERAYARNMLILKREGRMN